MALSRSFERKFRLLLADDDEDDRALFLEAISEIDSSINLIMVEDGEKLMIELKECIDVPDIIFLDLNMPRKNGKECLLEIQHYNHLHNVPIIIYSTSISSRDINETWSKDVMGFMRKPDSYIKLKELVAKIINQDFNQQGWHNEKILINLH